MTILPKTKSPTRAELIDRDKMCVIETCPNKARNNTSMYCNTHYSRLRAGKSLGDPIRRQVRGTCSLIDCDAPHASQGYCKVHAERYRRWGDPLYTKPVAERNLRRGRGKCTVEGCAREHAAQGRCKMHWAQIQPTRPTDRESVKRTYRRGQAQTLEQAWRYGSIWAGWEFEILSDGRRTAREIALLLGRSLAAVRGMRSRMRRDPATILRAGIAWGDAK